MPLSVRLGGFVAMVGALALGGCAGTAPAPNPALPQPTARTFQTPWPRPAPATAYPPAAYTPQPFPPAPQPAPLRPAPTPQPVPVWPQPTPPRPQPQPQPPAPRPTPPAGRDFDPDWLPGSSAEATRRREDGPWKYVVVHHSDSDRGCLRAIRDYHVKVRGWKDAGYDFVIGNGSLSDDGEIEVSGRWKRQEDGAHAGVAEYNKHGIGICIVGNLQDHGATPAQMKALARLVRFLCDRYNIPKDRDHVIGHGEFRSTQCPGAKFNWTDLMRRVQ